MIRILSGVLMLAAVLGAITGTALAQTAEIQTAVTSDLAARASRVAPVSRPVAPDDDQLHYMFFATDRPVLIRVHLRLHDKPYPTAWNGFMDKMFDWFDQDKSGFLEATEAVRIVPASFIQVTMQGGIGGGGNETVPFATQDTNKDGKVSREEFKTYYRNNGVGSLRFTQNNSEAQTATRINKALLSRLDRNGDGKLSRDEVTRLPELMNVLDENEDELLASTEISPGPVQNPYFGVPLAMDSPKGAEIEAGLQTVTPSDHLRLATALLKRYDRSKKGKLARGDSGLEEAEFAALDKNKDGVLTAEELTAFFTRQPDLTFRLKTGANLMTNTVLGEVSKFFGGASKTDRVEVVSTSKSASITGKVKRTNGDNVMTTLGDTRIAFQASDGSSGQVQGIRGFYMQQFNSVADKKDYIERKQQAENQNNPFVFQIFTQADKDADGKLTRKELGAWFDLLNEGSTTFVSLSINDRGRSLFQVLDADDNSTLSLRELRAGWMRLEPLCKSEKNLVLKELPRTMTLTANQGFFGGGRGRFVVSSPVSSGTGVMRKTGNVPPWFRKMDRNNDSDISPREWLGTLEEFAAVDLDGDGLISPAEAREAEDRRRLDKARK